MDNMFVPEEQENYRTHLSHSLTIPLPDDFYQQSPHHYSGLATWNVDNGPPFQHQENSPASVAEIVRVENDVSPVPNPGQEGWESDDEDVGGSIYKSRKSRKSRRKRSKSRRKRSKSRKIKRRQSK